MNGFETLTIKNVEELTHSSRRVEFTIPEKIINEIPFPIPLCVICSPNHIKKIVPATIVVTVDILKNIPGFITKLAEDSKPTDKP